MECQGQMTLAELSCGCQAQHELVGQVAQGKGRLLAGCRGCFSRSSARKIDGDVFFDVFRIVGTPENPSF